MRNFYSPSLTFEVADMRPMLQTRKTSSTGLVTSAGLSILSHRPTLKSKIAVAQPCLGEHCPQIPEGTAQWGRVGSWKETG